MNTIFLENSREDVWLDDQCNFACSGLTTWITGGNADEIREKINNGYAGERFVSSFVHLHVNNPNDQKMLLRIRTQQFLRVPKGMESAVKRIIGNFCNDKITIYIDEDNDIRINYDRSYNRPDETIVTSVFMNNIGLGAVCADVYNALKPLNLIDNTKIFNS